MVRRADQDGGREAAIHSGLESALGSHPCVALSSYQASPVYGSFSKQKSKKHPFWKKTALNPEGLGGQSPHHSDDLFLTDRRGNNSAGVRKPGAWCGR